MGPFLWSEMPFQARCSHVSLSCIRALLPLFRKVWRHHCHLKFTMKCFVFTCFEASKNLFFFLFDVTLFTVPWSFNLFCSFLQRCFRDMESLQRFRLQCALNFRLFCLWSSNFNLFFNSEIHFQNVPIFSMIVRAYSTWLLHAMSNRKSHKKWKYSQT